MFDQVFCYTYIYIYTIFIDVHTGHVYYVFWLIYVHTEHVYIIYDKQLNICAATIAAYIYEMNIWFFWWGCMMVRFVFSPWQHEHEHPKGWWLIRKRSSEFLVSMFFFAGHIYRYAHVGYVLIYWAARTRLTCHFVSTFINICLMYIYIYIWLYKYIFSYLHIYRYI